MSEILKDGLVAVPWMIMGLVVGFDLGRVFERSVRASARTRHANGGTAEPCDAPTRTPDAEPSPGADAQSDSQRKDCAENGNVGFGAHADIVPQTQEAENVSLGEVPATCAELSDMLLKLLKVGMTEDAKKNLIKADGSMADNACLLLAISYSFTKFVHTYAPSQATKSLSDSKIAIVKVIGKLIDDEQDGDLCHED